MERGDILEGTERDLDKAYHRIVYLDTHDGATFVGAVLTHRRKDNVLMDEAHFRKIDSENKPYIFVFENTCLVKGRFIKLQNWGPFKKIGEVTAEGLKFIETQTQNEPLMLWEHRVPSKNGKQ